VLVCKRGSRTCCAFAPSRAAQHTRTHAHVLLSTCAHCCVAVHAQPQELLCTRTWSTEAHPKWLALEVEGRLQIRPAQHLVAQHLMEHPGAVAQLNMVCGCGCGGGVGTCLSFSVLHALDAALLGVMSVKGCESMCGQGQGCHSNAQCGLGQGCCSNAQCGLGQGCFLHAQCGLGQGCRSYAQCGTA